MKNKLLRKTELIDKQFNVSSIILNTAKKRKQIIYGARSIQAQNNLLARPTKDYDIFDSNPKQASHLLQKLLDKNVGFNYYYNEPAKHSGTWKVKNKGIDGRKNTKDDENIADYTIKPNNIKTKKINGIMYRDLATELKMKIKTTKNPEFEFRHEKDKDDINRIRAYLKIKRLVK